MGNSLVGSRLSKKASAVTFSHDSSWLLVADKFGIVYVFSTVRSDAIHKPVLILAHCCSIITGLVWVCCLNSAPCMWWSFELAFLPLHKLKCSTYSRSVLNICMYISPPETSTPSTQLLLQLLLISLKVGTCLSKLMETGVIQCCSPDGKYIVTSDRDFKIRVSAALLLPIVGS
jgi:WD40 repeat protein